MNYIVVIIHTVDYACGGEIDGHPTGNLRRQAKTSRFLPPKAFGGIYRSDLPLG
jgi:hypothetical protein